MRLVTRGAKREPQIRALAASLVAYLPGKDWNGEIASMLSWVQTNIRYIFPTTGDNAFDDLQVLQYPQETLRTRAGACVDDAVLLASLLESIGHPTGFKAVGFQWDYLTHVYVVTRVGSQWVPCDPTVNEPVGWEPPGIINSLCIYNGS